MRAPLAIVMILVGLAGGCSSNRPAAPTRTEGTDVNTKHWSGTTGVLRGYRLPERSKAAKMTADVSASKQDVGKTGNPK